MFRLKGVIFVALVVSLSFTVGCSSLLKAETEKPSVNANVKQEEGPVEDDREEVSTEQPESRELKLTVDESLPAHLAATVNGKEISVESFERRVHKTQFVLEAQGYDFETNRDHAIKELRAIVIRELVYEEVLMQLADEMGALATEEEVDEVINNIKANFTPEEYQEVLKSRGITEENQRTYNRMQLTKTNLQAVFGNQEQMLKHLEDRVNVSKVVVNEPAIQHLLQKI